MDNKLYNNIAEETVSIICNHFQNIFSKSGSAPEEKKADNTESPQPPVRRIQPKAPASGDIFPRKVKSKLVKIKPALWEKNDEKLKNTILKKEKRKTKLG